MSKKNAKTQLTLIGIFVIASLTVSVFLLLSFGNSKWNRKTVSYNAYFSTSVKGLSVGSPLMFRGVKIGQVTGIRLASIETDDHGLPLPHTTLDGSSGENAAPAPGGDLQFPVQVELEVDPAQLGFQENWLVSILSRNDTNQRMAAELIEANVLKNGLCARLRQLSLLTGQLFIELNFEPLLEDEQPLLRNALAAGILPTRLSLLDKMSQQFNRHSDLSDQIEKFREFFMQISDFAGSGQGTKLLTDISEIAANINRISAALDSNLPAIIDECRTTIADLRQQFTAVAARLDQLMQNAESAVTSTDALVNHLDDVLSENQQEIAETLRQLPKTLDSAQAALDKSALLLAELTSENPPNAALLQELKETLSESRQTAQALQQLLELLSRNPQALILGR